jgi:hypothetical protein
MVAFQKYAIGHFECSSVLHSLKRTVVLILFYSEVKDIGNLMVKLGDYNKISAWNDIAKERKPRGSTDEE